MDIPIVVERARKLGILEKSFGKNKIEDSVLYGLKQTSCAWRPALASGRMVNFGLRLRVIYKYELDDKTQSKKLSYISTIKKIQAINSDFRDLKN